MFLAKFFDSVSFVLWVAGSLLFLFFFLVLLAPLFSVISPVATILFVLVGTVLAVATSRFTAACSVAGLILYSASWLLMKEYGILASQIICGAGTFLWFFAFSKSLLRSARA